MFVGLLYLRLLLLPQSGFAARFEDVVRVQAGGGEQAGPIVCLKCSRSQEGRSWSHVLPTFQYQGEVKAKSLFCFLLQPATSTLQLKSESAEEVTRRGGTAATEGLELVIHNRKSGVSYKCVIPLAATKGHCVICAWEYLAFWSPKNQICLFLAMPKICPHIRGKSLLSACSLSGVSFFSDNGSVHVT